MLNREQQGWSSRTLHFDRFEIKLHDPQPWYHQKQFPVVDLVWVPSPRWIHRTCLAWFCAIPAVYRPPSPLRGCFDFQAVLALA